MTELIKLTEAHRALMEAKTIDEVKDVRDRAESLRLYAKQAGYGLEMQNACAEIKLRAERRAGELLKETINHNGGRPEKNGNSVLPLHDFGLNKMQSSRFQTIARIPDEVFEAHIIETKTAKEELTSAGVMRLANNGLSQPMQVLLSHEAVDYYTPPEYIEAARQVMGRIDLDPASCKDAQKTVRAGRFYSEADDGLSREWYGCVWLNPPYSKTNGKSNQELWAKRLITEYQSGNVEQAILLVKSALGYKWFEELWDELPVCFARLRLSFTKSDGNTDGESKHGTALFYLGNDLPQFISVFSRFGRITTPDGRYIPQRSIQ